LVLWGGKTRAGGRVQEDVDLDPGNPVPWEAPLLDRVEGVTVVKDRRSAMRALNALYRHKDQVFACDTEVADIDVKVEGPVGNGKVSHADEEGQPAGRRPDADITMCVCCAGDLFLGVRRSRGGLRGRQGQGGSAIWLTCRVHWVHLLGIF
jgi:hypothetical protein